MICLNSFWLHNACMIFFFSQSWQCMNFFFFAWEAAGIFFYIFQPLPPAPPPQKSNDFSLRQEEVGERVTTTVAFFPLQLAHHWLVHDHKTSNNEPVYRQMSKGGNIAKTMKSNGKQFTVTREMLNAVARDQSVQLKVA